MYIAITDLAYCIGKAREIREEYERYSIQRDALPRSTDDLRDVVSRYLEKRIDFYELDVLETGRLVPAFFLAFEDHCEIYLLAGLENPERRFVLCKELFHVVLDKPECRTMQLNSHLQEVVAKFPVHDAEPNCPAVYEMLAEAAAMEFFMPYIERVRMRAGGELNFAEIAGRYGIPVEYVEIYLSDGYMDFFSEESLTRARP